MLIAIAADGFCIFDIAKPQRLAAGYASTLEFSNAAKQLRNQCLGNGGAEGGIAVNLGECLIHSANRHIPPFGPSDRSGG